LTDVWSLESDGEVDPDKEDDAVKSENVTGFVLFLSSPALLSPFLESPSMCEFSMAFVLFFIGWLPAVK